MTPAWTILSAFAAALLVLLLPARSAGLAKVIALVGSLIGMVAAAVSCLARLNHPDARGLVVRSRRGSPRWARASISLPTGSL